MAQVAFLLAVESLQTAYRLSPKVIAHSQLLTCYSLCVKSDHLSVLLFCFKLLHRCLVIGVFCSDCLMLRNMVIQNCKVFFGLDFFSQENLWNNVK